MVRGTRYKLIESVHNGILTTQLFDMIDDPYETNNLVNEYRYSNVVQRLKKRLVGWQQIVDDPIL